MVGINALWVPKRGFLRLKCTFWGQKQLFKDLGVGSGCWCCVLVIGLSDRALVFFHCDCAAVNTNLVWGQIGVGSDLQFYAQKIFHSTDAGHAAPRV